MKEVGIQNCGFMNRFFFLLLIIAFSSCENTSNTNVDDIKSSFVQNYSTIAYKKYSDALFFVEVLRSDLDKFIEDPNETTYQRLKTVWEHIRVPFGQSLVYRYINGPIDNNNYYYRINAPLINTSLIETENEVENKGIINDLDNYPTIDKDLISNLYLEQTSEHQDKTYAGIHVIEFLLWGSDESLDPLLSGDRTYQDFVNDEFATRRLDYFIAVVELLIDDMRSLKEQWQEEQIFTNSLKNSNNIESLSLIYHGIIKFLDDDLSDRMLNRILESNDTRYEESPFSDFTLNDIKYGVIGIENMFTGSYSDTEGNVTQGDGIFRILEEIDSETRDDIKEKINNIKSLIATINVPFDYALNSPSERQKLQDLHTQLKDLQQTLINSAIDLDLRYQV